MAMVHFILYDEIHVWFKFQSNWTELKPPQSNDTAEVSEKCA